MHALTRPERAAPLAATPTEAPSFAEALQLIDSWTDLTETRRRDLAAALRAASRIARRPLADLRCCPEQLNELLFDRSPAAAGLTIKRFRDVMSLIRSVLRRLGRVRPAEFGERMLGTGWQAFLDRLPDTPRRAALRGFARWCDRWNLEPIQVDDAALAAFVEEDRATRLAASTRDQGPNLAAAWTWACRLQADPGRFSSVTAPLRRRPYTLPFSSFPPSFQASVTAFATRLSGGVTSADADSAVRPGRFRVRPANPFSSPVAMRRPLKPATVSARVFSIRQAAAALHLTGTPLADIRELRDLVHPIGNAGRILDFYDRRAGGKSGGQLHQIAETLRQIGLFHADIPEPDRATLRDWAQQAQGQRRGEMGPKARGCLQQLVDQRHRARLLHLPAHLARETAAPDMTAVEAARRMRSALLIDLMITCPLRIGDVLGLRADAHFVHLDGNRRTPSHLVVPEGSSKTGEPISWPLAASTRQLLGVWLTRYRDALASPGCGFLFPGADDQPMSIGGLRSSFQNTIEQRLGLDVYPHALRHFAAYLFLQSHPGQYEVVRRILGHRSVETTVRFYCGLETDAAARAFDGAITRERAATRLLARASAGKGRRKPSMGRSV